jgi:hypothetical protein
MTLNGITPMSKVCETLETLLKNHGPKAQRRRSRRMSFPLSRQSSRALFVGNDESDNFDLEKFSALSNESASSVSDNSDAAKDRPSMQAAGRSSSVPVLQISKSRKEQKGAKKEKSKSKQSRRVSTSRNSDAAKDRPSLQEEAAGRSSSDPVLQISKSRKEQKGAKKEKSKSKQSTRALLVGNDESDNFDLEKSSVHSTLSDNADAAKDRPSLQAAGRSSSVPVLQIFNSRKEQKGAQEEKSKSKQSTSDNSDAADAAKDRPSLQAAGRASSVPVLQIFKSRKEQKGDKSKSLADMEKRLADMEKASEELYAVMVL